MQMYFLLPEQIPFCISIQKQNTAKGVSVFPLSNRNFRFVLSYLTVFSYSEISSIALHARDVYSSEGVCSQKVVTGYWKRV